MKIIKELADSRIKENRKDTLAIKLSILMAVVLLGSIIFISSGLRTEVYKFISTKIGDYHVSISELDKQMYNYLLKDKDIDKLEFEKIKSTDIGSISFKDSNYWQSPLIDIAEGDRPIKSTEIIVGSDFLLKNKSYHIGDNIRIGDKEYRIVGSYDKDYVSFETSDFFSAIENSSKESLLADKDLVVVNIWYKNKRDTYTHTREMLRDLRIDEKLALDTGKLYYNIDYLEYYMIYPQGIFPPKRVVIGFLENYTPFLLLSLLFAVMIYGAFNVWNNKDIREIALLKSVGMTGKQVRKMIQLKILRLAVLPIGFGLILSYGLANLLIYLVWLNNHISYLKYSSIMKEEMLAPDFQIIVPSLSTIVAILILSYFSVYISAIIPAIKSAKLEIVDGLKGILSPKAKNVKSSINGKIEKTLAKEYFVAYRKTYRVILIAMVLSALTLTFVLVIHSYRGLEEKYNQFEDGYNFSASIFTDENLDRQLISDLDQAEDETHLYAYKDFKFYLADNEGVLSSDLNQILADKERAYYVRIYGLGAKDYQNILSENKIKAGDDAYLILNKTPKSTKLAYKYREYVPLVDESVVGLKIRYHAKDKLMTIPISAYIYDFPYHLSPYRAKEISLFTRMENLEKLIGLKGQDEGDPVNYYKIKMKVDEERLNDKTDEYVKIISAYLPKTDYIFTNSNMEKAMMAEQTRNENLLLAGLQIILMIIALSNTYNSFKSNIHARKKDFILLYTAGMTDKQMKKLIINEGLSLFFKTLITYGLILLAIIMVKSYQAGFLFKPLEIFMNLDFIPIIMIFAVNLLGIGLSVKSSIKDVFAEDNMMSID